MLSAGWSLLLSVLATVSARRTDADLLAAIKAGDGDAWREVMGQYGPMLLGYAAGMVKDRARAEDVIQDALVAVMVSIAQFQGRCSLKSWLFRAVHNKAIDALRRDKRYVHVEDSEAVEWGHLFDSNGAWRSPPAVWGGSADARIDAKRAARKS